MKHTARGKNKYRRTAFTDAEELAVWCSMLEAYLEPYTILEKFAYATLVMKNQAVAKRYAKQIREAFKARQTPMAPKHTPEFKTLVVKSYIRARRGNKAKVLRQFGVTAVQLARWRIQVKYRSFQHRDHVRVARRLLADWTPPTPQMKVAASQDFAARIAAERRKEQLQRQTKAAWTRLRELPSPSAQVTNNAPIEGECDRLTFKPRFEIIE